MRESPGCPVLQAVCKVSAKAAPSVQAFFKILMGYRPPLPPDMPPGYRSVMTSCWSANPDDRPGFEVVISSLQVRRSQPTCGPLRDVAHPFALVYTDTPHLAAVSDSHADQGGMLSLSIILPDMMAA